MGNNMMQMPPAMQQQAPQQEQANNAPFPSSKEEAMKFSNDILQVLYSPETHSNIVAQLEQAKGAPIGNSLGAIAGNVVGNRVADVRGQTGRKIEMGLLLGNKKKPGGLQKTIMEIADIAESNGIFKASDKDKSTALKTAVEMLDKTAGAA